MLDVQADDVDEHVAGVSLVAVHSEHLVEHLGDEVGHRQEGVYQEVDHRRDACRDLNLLRTGAVGLRQDLAEDKDDGRREQDGQPGRHDSVHEDRQRLEAQGIAE